MKAAGNPQLVNSQGLKLLLDKPQHPAASKMWGFGFLPLKVDPGATIGSFGRKAAFPTCRKHQGIDVEEAYAVSLCPTLDFSRHILCPNKSQQLQSRNNPKVQCIYGSINYGIFI